MRKLLMISFCLFTLAAHSQQGNNDVQKGNDAYRNNDYKTAIELYQKALAKEPGNTVAKFNMANALLRQKDAAAANKHYDDILGTANDTIIKTRSFYNKGLALIKQQDLDGAITAFKQALNLAPGDNDTRENLQKALNEKRQQQQQQQNKKNKQDQKKEPPKPQQKEKPLNKQMMEQKFNELRNQEKQLQKQLQRKPQEDQPEKDW